MQTSAAADKFACIKKFGAKTKRKHAKTTALHGEGKNQT